MSSLNDLKYRYTKMAEEITPTELNLLKNGNCRKSLNDTFLSHKIHYIYERFSMNVIVDISRVDI